MRRLLRVITKPWHPGKKDVVTGFLAVAGGSAWTVISVHYPNLIVVDSLLRQLPGTGDQQWAIYWFVSMLTLWLVLDLLVFVLALLFSLVLSPLFSSISAIIGSIFNFFFRNHPPKREADFIDVTRDLKL
jgi:hypothetical protein